MSYYAKHVFFCCNQRDNGRVCCNDKGASEIRDYAKRRVKELGLSGEGKIRINQAGCLDRCEEGPCIVVYPEGVWYTYLDRADVDEIIEQHLQNGRVVEHLKPARLALAGFSFGAGVQAMLAQRVKAERLVLIGVAVTRFQLPNVQAGTLVVHGEQDETVPLRTVLDWARPQDLPVVVLPGADHFFHRKLHVLRGLVRAYCA